MEIKIINPERSLFFDNIEDLSHFIVVGKKELLYIKRDSATYYVLNSDHLLCFEASEEFKKHQIYLVEINFIELTVL